MYREISIKFEAVLSGFKQVNARHLKKMNLCDQIVILATVQHNREPDNAALHKLAPANCQILLSLSTST